VSSAENCASLYWSCLAGLPGDWRDRLCAWRESSAVAWLAVDVSEERLGLIDDEGRRVVLDISRPRPNGVVACSSGPKVVLGLLRIGQLLGFSLADEAMEKVDLRDIGAVLASALFSLPYESLEDMAFAIGLAPRAFRLRQLDVLAIPGEVFF
jgi:hypothetical protein